MLVHKLTQQIIIKFVLTEMYKTLSLYISEAFLINKQPKAGFNLQLL